MATSVSQYAQVADWFTSTNNRTISGLSWSSGDVIVVIGGNENADGTAGMNTPTNANLTFTLRASSTSGGSSESTVYVWTAKAGSTQSSQTITVSRTGWSNMFGAAAWVVTGADTVTNATANLSESEISRTVSSGSTIVYGLIDWNANNPPGKTPRTGSGTATERRDAGNVSNYAQWLADWVNTSAGTFTFGPNTYSGLQVAQAIVEVTATAGATQVDGTATAVSISTATADVVPTTQVDATPAAAAVATGTADVVPTTDVDATATSVSASTGTADVVPGSAVDGTSTSVTVTTGTADVVPTTDVDATATAVSITTGTADVVPTTEVDGTPTTISASTATADVSSVTDVDATPTTVTVTTAAADVVPTTEVDATATAVPVSTGTADVAPTTQVDGTATSVTVTTGTADITSTDIPQNVVATATGSSTISVTWDAVAGATGYDIERDGIVIVEDHTASPFNDSGLSPSTTYQYRVRSVLP